jgi:hypothetical protein
VLSCRPVSSCISQESHRSLDAYLYGHARDSIYITCVCTTITIEPEFLRYKKFRCHPTCRPSHARRMTIRRVRKNRQAKVSKADVVIVVYKNIGSTKIAMDDASRVEIFKSLSDLQQLLLLISKDDLRRSWHVQIDLG